MKKKHWCKKKFKSKIIKYPTLNIQIKNLSINKNYMIDGLAINWFKLVKIYLRKTIMKVDILDKNLVIIKCFQSGILQIQGLF